MRTKTVAGAVFVCLASSGLIYASPYLALRNIAKAVENKDADTVARYVDFPVLRENVKEQMLARLDAQLQSPETKDNPFANFGRALAASVVKQTTDVLVSPAGVMLMLKNGKPGKPADVVVAGTGVYANSDEPRKEYAFEYEGWSKIFVHPKGELGGFYFRRDRLLSWKLIAVKMD